MKAEGWAGVRVARESAIDESDASHKGARGRRNYERGGLITANDAFSDQEV